MIRTTAAVALVITTMFALPATAQTTAPPGDPKPAATNAAAVDSKITPSGSSSANQPADIGYKIVDPSDLFIGTRKYLDKPIVLRRMRCYYADVDDYRCMASGPVFLAVFTATVEPSSARVWIEENCGQLKVAVTSEKCLFNPQFVYGAKDVNDDIVSGYQQRKVIHPAAGVTMIPAKAIKSER
ncbi:hypothetical protein ACVWZR_004573 [Bradyrhizobium sp. i1.3.1]